MTRCFIALDLSNEIKEKIAELQEKIKENSLKLVEKKNLHITLLFLGELSENDKNSTIKSLKTVKFDSFSMKIGKIGFFPNDQYIRVIWLGAESDDLMNMARSIHSVLGKKFSFSSHLTIARVKRKPGPELMEKVRSMENIVIGKQTIDKFSLKKSTLTPDGPIYEDIKVYNSA